MTNGLTFKLLSSERPLADFALLLMLQLVFLGLVFLDIPFSRQAFVPLYLLFVPGFVILKVLNFRKLQRLDAILFSVGFSIAFLMVVGLIVNELGLEIGFSAPLSAIPLMIAINLALLLFSLLFLRKNQVPKVKIIDFIGVVSKTPLAILFLCLPFLTVIGSIWNNVYGNNLILLIVIASITLLFVLGLSSKKLLPPKLYPLAVLAIALATGQGFAQGRINF